MKIRMLLLALLLAGSATYAQTECDCAAEFKYIKQKVETNYVGFNDKIKQKGRSKYDSISNSILKLAPQAIKPAYCLFLVQRYLDYFQDGHLVLYRKEDSIKRPWVEMVRKARAEVTPVKLSPQRITNLKSATGAEGIFWNKDRSFRIAVINDENPFRNYVAQIMISPSNSWRPGDVLMEFNYDSVNYKFNGFQYTEEGLIQPISYDVKGNSFGPWLREGNVTNNNPEPAGIEKKVRLPWTSGKQLSPKTFYLRVASFNTDQARVIDSVVAANKAAIESSPYLIVDIRGNGGGSDFSYSSISPYLYTDSVKIVGADFYSTKDNITAWKKVAAQPDMPDETKEVIAAFVDSMVMHPGKMIHVIPDGYKKLTVTHPVPKKVVVLIDGENASTAEQFILEAMQSKKTTLMGTHSAGILDYANMLDIDFKTLSYTLGYPSSRSRRVDQGLAIDNVGIKPQIQLKEDQDWIAAAQLYLEGNSK
ncbi:S41 family peptidase [Chitinophaga sp. Cy-1792]|uniref:S41 family peptidase n=1 Tax=Chitinophaga sp. Cy-1792 TaxID=2608339 RepID=UPI001420E021|nr:S41 family peptidase [Chitinophaga sp. Cy-1792]NIG53375.1 hypothetical protein [Chitinophaga sp. Cy-1792]